MSKIENVHVRLSLVLAGSGLCVCECASVCRIQK